MAARFEAFGNGTTGVNVGLHEGGRSGNSVRLTANERLEVNANGRVVILDEDEDFLDVDYDGSVPTDASNTLLTLSLFRGGGFVSAVQERTVRLPLDF